MDTYAISRELLDSFIEAIPLETMLFLYEDYSEDLLSKNTPPHRLPTFESFQIKDIRFVIFNKLVTTKYNILFMSLEQQELAMLLNISTKEYNALYTIALKKLKISVIKENKEFMETSLSTLQELYYTAEDSYEIADQIELE